MDGIGEDPLDWEAFLDHLPEFEIDDFFLEDTPVEVAAADDPSPNPSLSEIENLLMADADVIPGTPSSKSDYDKLLAEILVEPSAESEDGSTPSDKDRVDAATPEDDADEPEVKKLRRQMRNRDAAVRSRERKKSYVKDLEMKSKFFEGECRRLGHLLQCCYAENHALRFSLQSRGAFGASMTKQESAVLLLESLLLGSLLRFMGIMCQFSLPLILWLTVVLPRENMEQKGLRRVGRKGPESKISDYFRLQSFVKSRRCRASRTKMKFEFLMFYKF
ncbi:bZIP transcription factor 60 [Gastrolobium bilobum]|uniref:bZIP transcription factor 60 n=1 Tax=Gastrolobium bilobum TaxID=150636 RepID=UPI002AB1E56D|nr:bZIP transcription factor 60 [Gastrolobium bilobum]